MSFKQIKDIRKKEDRWRVLKPVLVANLISVIIFLGGILILTELDVVISYWVIFISLIISFSSTIFFLTPRILYDSTSGELFLQDRIHALSTNRGILAWGYRFNFIFAFLITLLFFIAQISLVYVNLVAAIIIFFIGLFYFLKKMRWDRYNIISLIKVYDIFIFLVYSLFWGTLIFYSGILN